MDRSVTQVILETSIVAAAVGLGFLLVILFGASFLVGNDALRATSTYAAVLTMLWAGAPLIGALAGARAGRHTRVRPIAMLAGGMGGAIGFMVLGVLVGLSAMIGFAMADTKDFLGDDVMGDPWKSLLLVFAAFLTGAIAGAFLAVPPDLSKMFATTTPTQAGFAPAGTPMPAATAAPVAVAPYAAGGAAAMGSQAATPATVVRCPRCGTDVHTPPYRPVDLTCPNCRFSARLET